MTKIKDGPVVRLAASAKEFNFSKLKAGQDNKLANFGETMFRDFDRMDFVINGREIDRSFIAAFKKGAENYDSKFLDSENVYNNKSNDRTYVEDFEYFVDLVFGEYISDKLDELWEDHRRNSEIADHQKTDSYKKEFEEFYNVGWSCGYLLAGKMEENKDYRPFAKEVFRQMFKHAEAEVPSDAILEDLVTNCNQAGYDAALFTEVQPALGHSFIVHSPKKVMSIDCANPNNVRIRSDMEMPIFHLSDQGMHGDKICDLSHSLEFTLESQGGEDFVAYVDGKMSLTIPEELKNYKDNGKSWFNVVKEYFETLCAKLGFKFKKEIRIEHEFDTKLEGTISTEGSEASKEFKKLLSENLRDGYSKDESLINNGYDEEDINSIIITRVESAIGLLGDCAKLKNSTENKELLVNELADNLGLSIQDKAVKSLPYLINGSVNYGQVQDIANIFASLILEGKPEVYTQKDAVSAIEAIHNRICNTIAAQEKDAPNEEQGVEEEHKWTDKIKEERFSVESHGQER